MNIFNFRCKACGKVLKHHSRKDKNGDIIEDELCSFCKQIALEGIPKFKNKDTEYDF